MAADCPQRTIVMNVETDRLIHAVQSRPVIWDATHEDYKDGEMRTAAWREICEEFFEGYGEFSRHVQKAAVKKLAIRWRTARDSYIKTKSLLQKSSGNGKVKMYIYYDIMTFLDRPSGEQPKCNESEAENSDAEEETADPLSEKDFRTNPKRKKDNSDSEHDMTYAKRKKVKPSKVKPDDDWSFFKSIMPTLKKFTNIQKLRFRSEVLKFLIDVEQASDASSVERSSEPDCSSSYVKYEK